MSERGSFITEYIYCPDCFKKLRKVLVGKNEAENFPASIHGYLLEENLPIIAGFLHGYDPGPSIFFQHHLFNEENAPCHPVNVILISDMHGAFVSRFELVTIMPDGMVWNFYNEMEGVSPQKMNEYEDLVGAYRLGYEKGKAEKR